MAAGRAAGERQQAAQRQGDHQIGQSQEEGREHQPRRQVALGGPDIGLGAPGRRYRCRAAEVRDGALQVEGRARGLGALVGGAAQAHRRVKSRWVRRTGLGGGERVRAQRRQRSLRRVETAEGVEHAVRLQRRALGAADAGAQGQNALAASARTAPRGAGWSRRCWPWCGPGSASPCRAASPVTRGVPSASEAMVSGARSGPGSASTCRLTLRLIADRQPGERAVGRKRRQRQGLGPGQRPAQRPVAGAQPGRDQIVRGGGELGSGEAQQDAAGFDPGFELGPLLGVDGRRCRPSPAATTAAAAAPRAGPREFRRTAAARGR